MPVCVCVCVCVLMCVYTVRVIQLSDYSSIHAAILLLFGMRARAFVGGKADGGDLSA